MRSKEVIGTVAVVASLAIFALLNTSSIQGESLFRHKERYADSFQYFINKYGRRYGTKEEFNFRLKIFIENYHFVMDHNSMNAESDGFTVGLNMFSDMTNEEYRQRLGLKQSSNG